MVTRTEFLAKKCERRLGSVTASDGEKHYFRSLNAKEYGAVQSLLAWSNRDPNDWPEYKASHLVAMLTDEAGNQLLTPDDMGAVLELPPMLVDELYEACLDHLAMDGVTVEETKKN